jgi:hypothetical protein
MEMSPFPQKALRAGDRLRELVPDSGHLVHMADATSTCCAATITTSSSTIKRPSSPTASILEREGPMNIYSHVPQPQLSLRGLRRDVFGQYTPALQAAQELIDTTPEALLRIHRRRWPTSSSRILR